MKYVLIASISTLIGVMMGFLIESENHSKSRTEHETEVNSYTLELDKQRSLLSNTEFNLEQCKKNNDKSVDIINDLTAIVNMQLDLFYDLSLETIDAVRKERPKPPYLQYINVNQPQVIEGLQ